MTKSRHARSLTLGALLTVFALTSAPDSLAQDVTIEVRGVVATNTLTTGPFSGASPGERCALRLTIDLGSVRGGTVHVHVNCPVGAGCGGGGSYNYSTYDIDMSTVQFSVGNLSSMALSTPASEVILVNDYQGVDKFGASATLAQGAGFVRCNIRAPEEFMDHLGAPLSSTGVTTIPTVIPFLPGSFAVYGSVFGESLQIEPTEIETMSLFALSCHGDGGVGLGCTDCPCSNNNLPGRPGGCLNSDGNSVLLYGEGTPSITGDTFRLRLRNSSPGTLGYLISGGNQLSPPSCAIGSGVQNAFDDGLRCVGGTIRRHGPRVTLSSGQINQYSGLLFQGGFALGQVRHFQYFYRDGVHGGCSTGRNTSNALTITVVP